MSHSIAFELPRDFADAPRGSADATEAKAWSARRRLACLVALSAVSWLAILIPVMIWG